MGTKGSFPYWKAIYQYGSQPILDPIWEKIPILEGPKPPYWTLSHIGELDRANTSSFQYGINMPILESNMGIPVPSAVLFWLI